MNASVTPNPNVAAIIVAAGRGTRFGATNKVLLPLAGEPVLVHSLRVLLAAPGISQVVIVAGEHTYSAIVGLAARASTAATVVLGGERRQDSVAAGLAHIGDRIDLVVIHDGARPFLTPRMVGSAIAAAATHGAAIVAVPVRDTIKRVTAGFSEGTVPRDDLWAAQTPQAFRLDRLRAGLAHAVERGLTVTDEATLFEELGWPVAIVPGSPENIKITERPDLAVAEALMTQRSARQDTQ